MSKIDADFIIETGDIGAYINPTKIRELKLTAHVVSDVIKKTNTYEEYVTQEIMEAAGINGSYLVELVIGANRAEEFLNPQLIKEYRIDSKDIANLIRSTGKFKQYLTPEIMEAGLKFNFLVDIIIEADAVLEYLEIQQLERNKKYLSARDVVRLIRLSGDISKYLTVQIVDMFGIEREDLAQLAIEAGKAKEYLSAEKVEKYNFNSFEVEQLITSTGDVDKYLTLGVILAERKRGDYKKSIANLVKQSPNPEQYLFPNQSIDVTELSMANIIYKNDRENMGKYLDREVIRTYDFSDEDKMQMIELIGDYDKYMTVQWLDGNLRSKNILKILIKSGNIPKYVTEELLYEIYFRGEEISYLLYESGMAEKILEDPIKLRKTYGNRGETPDRISDLIKMVYKKKLKDFPESDTADEYLNSFLFEGQTIDSKLTLANVIKRTQNIELYLDIYMNEYGKLELSSEDKVNLVRATGNIPKYLNPECIEKLRLETRYITKLIKQTGDILKYLEMDGLNITGEYALELIVELIESGEANRFLTVDNIKRYKLNPKYLFSLLVEMKNTIDVPITKEMVETAKEINSACSNEISILEEVANLEYEKQADAIKILHRLDTSNSAELRRIKLPIAIQLFNHSPEDQDRLLDDIENIYLNDNIPNICKKYLVFEDLHPIFLGKSNHKLKHDESMGDIPVLNSVEGKERANIIFSDLLLCAMESNDRNFKEYLDTLVQGNEVYQKYKDTPVETLSSESYEILKKYSDMINSVYNLTEGQREKEIKRSNSGDVFKDIAEITELFNCQNTPLPDKIVETFCKSLGMSSVKQVQDYIEQVRQNVHNKNSQASKKGYITLKKGDFIKGVADTEYFGSMLNNGLLAKDFLGGNANHDVTPFDMDVELITSESNDFSKVIKSCNIATGFTSTNVSGKKLGFIMLVFDGDDYVETRNKSLSVNEENINLLKNNRTKKEVFCNGFNAYGIRTGTGSTNIKCIIADRYVDKLGLEIAKNGFYIPIVDKSGKIIYTEEMYMDFRNKMQGLSHYGENTYVVDSTAKNTHSKSIKDLVKRNTQDAHNKYNKIIEFLRQTIAEFGYTMSTKRDRNLTPGVIEFIDTGSTGRGTNFPGDGDFDFMVRLDRDLKSKPESLKQCLRDKFNSISPVNKQTETGEGDFRYKGVTIDGLDKDIDIDLTFRQRSNETEYSTDESIKDRLRTIRNQSEEDYEYVVANILIAKKFMKNIGAYKSKTAAEPEVGSPDTRGGLGAVGIENWILQNGGSFYKAAKEFMAVAEKCSTLDEFCEQYSIWDFGENYLSEDRANLYAHDNFVYNMNQTGYQKIKNSLERYIKQMESQKISMSDFVMQDTSVIENTEYMKAVQDILSKQQYLDEKFKGQEDIG